MESGNHLLHLLDLPGGGRDGAPMQEMMAVNNPLVGSEAIERLAREILPPGGRAVSVRIDDGPPRRGILYRTDTPFSPMTRELKAPDGKTSKAGGGHESA